MEKEKKKYDITKNPAYITGRRLLDEKEVFRKRANIQAEEATKNAPKGERYEGYITDFGKPDIRQTNAKQLMQEREKQRNINIESARQHEQNKARGTSSSSVRKLMK